MDFKQVVLTVAFTAGVFYALAQQPYTVYVNGKPSHKDKGVVGIAIAKEEKLTETEKMKKNEKDWKKMKEKCPLCFGEINSAYPNQISNTEKEIKDLTDTLQTLTENYQSAIKKVQEALRNGRRCLTDEQKNELRNKLTELKTEFETKMNLIVVKINGKYAVLLDQFGRLYVIVIKQEADKRKVGTGKKK